MLFFVFSVSDSHARDLLLACMPSVPPCTPSTPVRTSSTRQHPRICPRHPALVTRVRFNTLAYASIPMRMPSVFPCPCYSLDIHAYVLDNPCSYTWARCLVLTLGVHADPRRTCGAMQVREQVQEVWDSRGCRRSKEGMGHRSRGADAPCTRTPNLVLCAHPRHSYTYSFVDRICRM